MAKAKTKADAADSAIEEDDFDDVDNVIDFMGQSDDADYDPYDTSEDEDNEEEDDDADTEEEDDESEGDDDSGQSEGDADEADEADDSDDLESENERLRSANQRLSEARESEKRIFDETLAKLRREYPEKSTKEIAAIEDADERSEALEATLVQRQEQEDRARLSANLQAQQETELVQVEAQFSRFREGSPGYDPAVAGQVRALYDEVAGVERHKDGGTITGIKTMPFEFFKKMDKILSDQATLNKTAADTEERKENAKKASSTTSPKGRPSPKAPRPREDATAEEQEERRFDRDFWGTLQRKPKRLL